jgi:hypothetical protein
VARVDALDGAQLAVRDATLAIRCGHLNAIASGKGTLGFAIERHTVQASRVVAHPHDRHLS